MTSPYKIFDSALRSARRQAVRLHKNDQGDIPVGTILLIALVVIPLVLLLIFYRKAVVTYFTAQWNNLMNKGQQGATGP